MSDTVNPYQSPEAAAVPVKPLTAQGSLSEPMLIYLKGASPWLRFIGILGFISSAVTALWGLAFFAFIPLTQGFLVDIPGFESLGNISNALGIVLGGSMGLLIIGAGALMFFPSLFTYRFGEKIRGFLRTGADEELELAFKNNKSLWKFLGILCIVQLAIIPAAIVGGIILAVFAAFP